jgi:phenylacetate-CoA ligase
MYGYPTLINEFVHHCMAAGVDGRELRLRVVICTGEVLLPSVKQRLSAFFGCPVVNEYGCTESGVIAIECEAGTMHLLPAAAFGEIVQEDGTPTPAGTTGEVVVSDLYGRAAPLLRYRLHDLAVPGLSAACSCGRDLPSIALQRGRVDSFIQTPERGRIYDAILAYTVPPEIRKFRVYQESITQLRAEVVPGHGFAANATVFDCQRRWEEALGPGISVAIEVVHDIPLTTAGKLRYFVPMPSDPSAEQPA